MQMIPTPVRSRRATPEQLRVRASAARNPRHAACARSPGYARPRAPNSTLPHKFSYLSGSEDLVQVPRLQDKREVGTMAHFTNGGTG
jgi:hypothetical protein